MYKHLTISFFSLLILIADATNAQIINIDRSDTSNYSNHTKTSFNFSTGLEIDKQITTLYDATNKAELMLQHNKDLFLFAASFRFTYNGPDDILNAGYFHLRYRHNYKNKFQPEPFLQHQWDNKRGLEYRSLVGCNIRYNFWKGTHFDFNAGIGLMMELERWNYVGVEASKTPINKTPISNEYLKLNSYLRLDWKPNENNNIALNIFLQTQLGQLLPRIAPHVQWNIKAGKHVGFSVGFSGLYDSAPVVPISHFYYNLTNSFQFNF